MHGIQLIQDLIIDSLNDYTVFLIDLSFLPIPVITYVNDEL